MNKILGNSILVLLLVTVTSFTGMAQKRTISGVTFDAKTTVNSKMLLYNGGGLREKYFIDLYVAALYLKRPSMDADKIINGDQEMSIRIELVSNAVTREKFVETVEEGFGKASHGKATKSEIKDFMGFFKDEFKKGDKIDIDYIPGTGVVVKKNGKKLGTASGLDFKKALFSIWLGTKPADSSLKKGMLGKV